MSKLKVTAQHLPNEPILIIKLYRDYVVGKDTAEMLSTVNEQIGENESGLYSIYDLTEMKMSFGDLVMAMSNQAQKAPGAMADPRVTTVIVGSSEMVKLGVQAFQQEQYGNLRFPLYESVEEALKYAREQLAKR